MLIHEGLSLEACSNETKISKIITSCLEALLFPDSFVDNTVNNFKLQGYSLYVNKTLEMGNIHPGFHQNIHDYGT